MLPQPLLQPQKGPGTGPHAGRSFRLETMIEDNGYSRRYIVIETTVP